MTQTLHSNERADTPVMANAPVGLQRGTIVFTMTGARPVEALHPGDRIVTRSGACALRGLSQTRRDAFLMEFDRPEVVFLEDGQIRSDTCTPYVN